MGGLPPPRNSRPPGSCVRRALYGPGGSGGQAWRPARGDRRIVDGDQRSRGEGIARGADAGCIALAAVAFAYVVVRAASLSFVHDESLSYLHYAFPGVPLADVLRFEGFAASNNHLLNTLGMRAAALLFGPWELALRLPNVLALLPYLGAAYALTRRLRSVPARLAAFTAVAANPFALDFFGLARGYGLALAGAALALWFLVRCGEDDGRAAPRHAAWAAVFSGLAALAQFAFVVFHVATLAVVGLLALRRAGAAAAGEGRVGVFARQVALPAAFSALALLVAVPALWKLRAVGELYIGGREGLFANTLRSLLRSSAYATDGNAALETVAVGACLALVGVGYALLAVRARDDAGGGPTRRAPAVGLVPLALLLVMAAGTVALHHLLDANYPEDRAALPFALPLVLAIGFAADELTRRGPWLRPMGHAAAGLLLLGAVWAAARGANLDHTLLWAYDADTRVAMRELARAGPGGQGAAPPDGAGRIGVSWRLEPSVNFYILRFGMRWLAFAHRGGLASEPFDYYFHEPQDGAALAGTPVVVLRIFPRTGNVLAARVPTP